MMMMMMMMMIIIIIIIIIIMSSVLTVLNTSYQLTPDYHGASPSPYTHKICVYIFCFIKECILDFV